MKTPSVFFPACFSLSFFLYLCLPFFFFKLFTLTECDVLFDVVITVLLSLCHFAVIWNIRVVVSDAVYFVTSEHWRIFLLVVVFFTRSLSKCKCIRFVRRLLSNEQSHCRPAHCTKHHNISNNVYENASFLDLFAYFILFPLTIIVSVGM